MTIDCKKKDITGPAWLTGGENIAGTVGVRRQDLPEMVRNDGFPAFKWRGRWRACPDDIVNWTKAIAIRHKPSRRRPRG